MFLYSLGSGGGVNTTIVLTADCVRQYIPLNYSISILTYLPAHSTVKHLTKFGLEFPRRLVAEHHTWFAKTFTGCVFRYVASEPVGQVSPFAIKSAHIPVIGRMTKNIVR